MLIKSSNIGSNNNKAKYSYYIISCMLNIYALAFILGMAITLIGCKPKTIYNTYKHTPIAGWEKNDTLNFEVPRIKNADTYNTSLGIRINSGYPFTAISVIVKQQIYPKAITITDTVKCSLKKSQKIITNGVSLAQYNFKVKQLLLNKGDSLHISVYHIMKKDMLPGISDVGLEIRKM